MAETESRLSELVRSIARADSQNEFDSTSARAGVNVESVFGHVERELLDGEIPDLERVLAASIDELLKGSS